MFSFFNVLHLGIFSLDFWIYLHIREYLIYFLIFQDSKKKEAAYSSSDCRGPPPWSLVCCGSTAKTLSLPTQIPQNNWNSLLITKRANGQGKSWLHSQLGNLWDHWMHWKQDFLLWLQTSKWVPFKGTKVPSFSIRAGLETGAPVLSVLSPSSQRVWLHNRFLLIGQLLLISSENHDDAKKEKDKFFVKNTKQNTSFLRLHWGMQEEWFECHN